MKKMEEGRSLFIQACHCLFDCKEPDLKQQGLLLLKKAAEQEDPLALCLLGDFYVYGKGDFCQRMLKNLQPAIFRRGI